MNLQVPEKRVFNKRERKSSKLENYPYLVRIMLPKYNGCTTLWVFWQTVHTADY